ncbi:hypothetical protein SKAU_G00210190 [Synaphobranchus kaupii]|uniref:Uncharacterized protein n=1 Tax=Synaphobranchus kaupii TaxID=118154 RepID=A0A9Q1F8Z7_SYNKA|nr:hypothetical protein SKAU_G00210190 [Synaphobranchus kaupii]
MDPADPAQARVALEQQGAMQGRHHSQLDTVTQHLRTLASCVAELTSALRTLAPGIAPQQPPVQTPPGFLSAPPCEPQLPPPEKYADLDDLISIAIRVDTRLQDRQRFQGSTCVPKNCC